MSSSTISGLAQQVIAFWNGGAYDKGVTLAKLNAFERKYSIRLPESFCQIYLISDGTGGMDSHEIIFDQFQSIEESYVKRKPNIFQ